MVYEHTRTNPDMMRVVATKAMAALSRSDVAGMAAHMTDDAVLEFPYAPPRFPSRFQGRQAIIDGMTLLFTMFESFEIWPAKSYASPASHSLTVQAKGRGVLKSGAPYLNDYAILLVFKGDQICLWREYYNPMQLPSA